MQLLVVVCGAAIEVLIPGFTTGQGCQFWGKSAENISNWSDCLIDGDCRYFWHVLVISFAWDNFIIVTLFSGMFQCHRVLPVQSCT